MRNGRKLWVEVHVDLYEVLQSNAKKRNITFTKYINRALLRYTLREEVFEKKKNHTRTIGAILCGNMNATLEERCYE